MIAQDRSRHSLLETRQARRQRSRNLRIGLVLIGSFVVMFAGAIIYIAMRSGMQ